MRIKKLFAAVLAAGLCLMSATTQVKAEDITNATGNDWFAYVSEWSNWTVDARSAGVDVASVYGVEFTFTCADVSGGINGQIIINAENDNWSGYDWGNSGQPIEVKETGNANEYTIALIKDTPTFVDGESYSNFVLKQYWGEPMVITAIKFIGADGKAIGEAAEEAPAETPGETPAEAEEPVVLPKTGLVSGLVFVAVGAVVSAAGVVVAKKKED